MQKKREEVFIITPLWNFLSQANGGALTPDKYSTLKRITKRFHALLRKKGYEVSSLAEMADLDSFSEYEMLSALQDSCYIDTLMANIHAQIANSEIVTTIPVNIMTDSLVSELKSLYQDRFVNMTQLLEITNEEIARQVQIAMEMKKSEKRLQFLPKKSAKRNKRGLSVNKKRNSLSDSVRL